MPVICAFKEIVVKQRTPDGKPWWPAQILDELWQLWESRPWEPGHKIQFLVKYGQIISRLRRGVTQYYVKDPFLFELIEKFVRKHARPGDGFALVPPLSLSKLIFIVAKDLMDFFNIGRGFPITLDGDEHADAWHHDSLGYPWWFGGGYMRRQDVKGVDPSLSYITVHRLTDPRLRRGENSQSGDRYLADRYLALKMPAFNPHRGKSYWPAIFFSSDYLHLEYGFYIPSATIAFFRPVSLRGFCVLDIRMDIGEPAIIPEGVYKTPEAKEIIAFFKSDYIYSSNISDPYMFAVLPDKTEENRRFAERHLKFLDIK